jgi:hypothetical protein
VMAAAIEIAICGMWGLTPELSRAAKRRRLGRIVSAQPACHHAAAKSERRNETNGFDECNRSHKYRARQCWA